MANNTTIGMRIKMIREEKGFTQEELAKALGLNKSTIQRYESAKIEKIKLPVIDAIAQKLDVNPEWLSDKTDTRLSYSESEPTMPKIPYTEAGCVKVPLIGRVAAGYTCHAEDIISAYVLTDSDILNDGYEYFWLEVKGDSMEPELHENDLVLVRRQDVLEKPCYAVVTVDNEDGVVKLVDIENTRITLSSVNPYYPQRVFRFEEMNRVKLIGKVIQVKRNIE